MELTTQEIEQDETILAAILTAAETCGRKIPHTSSVRAVLTSSTQVRAMLDQKDSEL